MSNDVQLKKINKFDNVDGSNDSNYGSQSTVVDGVDAAYTNRGYQPDALEEKKEPPSGPMDEIEQDEESSDDEEPDTAYAKRVYIVRTTLVTTYEDNKTIFWYAVAVVLALLYFAYFAYAMYKTFDPDQEEPMRLLVTTIIVTVFVICKLMCNNIGALRDLDFNKFFAEDDPKTARVGNVIYWILTIGTAIFAVVFVLVDVFKNDRPENLISALGMICFVLLFYIFSHNPAKVKWRPVFWGLALQFYLALFILRWEFGYRVFEWLGDRVSEFLAHTDAGSAFVFGEDYVRHYFAFKVLTVIIFFSSIVSVLYYLGVMQFVIKYIARFLAFCLGTSPTESLNAAGNIFIGQTEAPLMIRPFLKDMTRSELHAVCTGGFATIAGAVMAAYILMGVPPNHLLSASVMSAPAALGMAKLFYPETKKIKANSMDIYNMKKGTENNIIEAASNGATVSIKLIANIVVNLIAFIAILEFINKSLTWFGHRADVYSPEPVTFYLICSYVFYPVAWLLGTENTYCDIRKVARLIGVKTFLNEFVAYADLSVIIGNTAMFHEYETNKTGLFNETARTVIECNRVTLGNGTVLENGIMTDRSIVLATYALCGFSNIGSIGIVLGALSAMAPNRKKDLTKIIVRAMIAGNVACFMTACIAGVLYEGPK